MSAARPEVPGFEVLEKLGAGGMGEVWRARQTHPGGSREVALKLLDPTGSRSFERFRREIELLLRVDRHPHIVRLLAADLDARPRPWLAMERIAGETLAARLAAPGGLSLEQTWRVGAELADALAFLHAKGIVHRDLKPANVLIRASDGAACLADFGIAWTPDMQALTRTGELAGSLPWMAPEAFESDQHRGPALDQWALGVILFECLTGRLPFEATSPFALATRICAGAAPLPSAIRPELPPQADALLGRMLERDPARRYPSISAARDDLRRLFEGRDTTDLEATGRQVRNRSRGGSRRRGLIALAVGLGLLLLLALGAVRESRRREHVRRFERGLKRALIAARERAAAPSPLTVLVARRALAAVDARVLPPEPTARSELALLEQLEVAEADARLAETAARLRAAPELRAEQRRRHHLRLLDGAAAATSLPERALMTALERLRTDPAESLAELRPAEHDEALARPAAALRVAALTALARFDDAEAALASLRPLGPANLEALAAELAERRMLYRLLDAPVPPDPDDWAEFFADSGLEQPTAGAGLAASRTGRFAERLQAELNSRPAPLDRLARRMRRVFAALEFEGRLTPPPRLPEPVLRALLERELRAGDAIAMLTHAALLYELRPDLESDPTLPILEFSLMRSGVLGELGPPESKALIGIRLATITARYGIAFRTVLPEHTTLVRESVLDRRARRRPDDPLLRYWVILRGLIACADSGDLVGAEERLRSSESLVTNPALPNPWRARLRVARARLLSKQATRFAGDRGVPTSNKADWLAPSWTFGDRESLPGRARELLLRAAEELRLAAAEHPINPSHVALARVENLQHQRAPRASILALAEASIAIVKEHRRRAVERRLRYQDCPGAWRSPIDVDLYSSIRFALNYTRAVLLYRAGRYAEAREVARDMGPPSLRTVRGRRILALIAGRRQDQRAFERHMTALQRLQPGAGERVRQELAKPPPATPR